MNYIEIFLLNLVLIKFVFAMRFFQDGGAHMLAPCGSSRLALRPTLFDNFGCTMVHAHKM